MDLDGIILESLERWKVPGCAVAVLRNGEISHLSGHGLANAFTGQAVTPDTVFAIASCTKAFAATACALLVQEGRLDWDDLVRRHLPDFHLCDPLADAEVTVRDLLCHRTGLGQHDLLWRLAPWDFSEAIRRLGSVKLSAPFRSRYEYNNFHYVVIGDIISAAAQEPWHRFVDRRIFRPLGMRRSVFSTSELENTADVASPHRIRSGQLELVLNPDEARVRASGSIRTCVRDLARWLAFQLSAGVSLDGTRILAAAHLAQTHTPQVVHAPPIELSSRLGTVFATYGLGWHVLDFRGEALSEHSGRLGGFRAHVALILRRGIGIAVLANLRHTDMVVALSRRLLDVALGISGDDWDGEYLRHDAERREAARQAKEARVAARKHNTCPSCQLAAYAGVFRESGYGDVVVDFIPDGQTLVLWWSSFRARLEHYHHDTFMVSEGCDNIECPVAGTEVTFGIADDDNVEWLEFLDRRFVKAGDEAGRITPVSEQC